MWTVRPLNSTPLPSERVLASAWSSETGKLRSASTLSRVSPTRPVAPTTATENSDFFIVYLARHWPRGARVLFPQQKARFLLAAHERDACGAVGRHGRSINTPQ